MSHEEEVRLADCFVRAKVKVESDFVLHCQAHPHHERWAIFEELPEHWFAEIEAAQAEKVTVAGLGKVAARIEILSVLVEQKQMKPALAFKQFVAWLHLAHKQLCKLLICFPWEHQPLSLNRLQFA